MDAQSLQKQLDKKAEQELTSLLHKTRQDLQKTIASIIGTNDFGTCRIRLEGKDFNVSINDQFNDMFHGLKTAHIKSYQERITNQFIEGVEALKAKHQELEEIVNDLQQ